MVRGNSALGWGLMAVGLACGCGDSQALIQADATLQARKEELAVLQESIKQLPGLQQAIRDAQVRVAKLEKERDALRKAGAP